MSLRGPGGYVIELARRLMEDRIRRYSPKFSQGQKVWLEAKNLKLPYAHRKLAPKREGPFVISDVMGKVTYKLKLPTGWRVHPVFHASLLSPYHENNVHGPNYLRKPPDNVQDMEQWEVAAIVNHKWSKKYKEYLFRVRWKTYGSSDDTWEWEDAFDDSREIFDAYKKKNEL